MKYIIIISANRHHEPYPVYPLGVSYLKTYLSQHLTKEYETIIIDANRCTNDEIYSQILLIKPVYVGISLRNVDGANSLDIENFLNDYKNIAKCVRKATKVPLIIGGAGFSVLPSFFMDELKADYGIVGEGEKSLLKLIIALSSKQKVDEIEGLILPNEKRPKYNHTDYLDTLNVKFEEDLIDYYWLHSGMINIQTKRGCPYNCIYCSYPVIDGRIVRTLDVDKIVADIVRLKREKGIDYFFFTDSVFNICNEYNRKLAKALVDSQANIRWGAYFSPKNLTEEDLILYKASGLTHIEFGTESLCDSTLKAYGKLFTFEDIKRVSDICDKLNIYYAHFLILGGYGETQESIDKTFENSKLLTSTVFFPYIGMRIYPHTKLQQIAIDEHVIDAEDPLLESRFYTIEGLDIDKLKEQAAKTGKAWIFPDAPGNKVIDILRIKKHKKGPLWEYLRMP